MTYQEICEEYEGRHFCLNRLAAGESRFHYRAEDEAVIWTYQEGDASWSATIELDPYRNVCSISEISGDGPVTEELYDELDAIGELLFEIPDDLIYDERVLVVYSVEIGYECSEEGWLVEVTPEEMILILDSLADEKNLDEVKELRPILNRAYDDIRENGLTCWDALYDTYYSEMEDEYPDDDDPEEEHPFTEWILENYFGGVSFPGPLTRVDHIENE